MSASNQVRSRTWRLLGWVVVAVVGLAALAVAVVEIALHQPAVRQAIIRTLASEVAARSGLQLEVADLRVSLIQATARIDELSLATPGRPPWFTASELEVSLKVSSLWNAPLTLRRLVITEPRLDLEQPLPSIPVAAEGGETEFGLLVEHLALDEGRVDGPVLPPQLEGWIDRWWLEDVEVRGRLDASDIELSLGSRARWQRRDGGEVEVVLEGYVEGLLGGPWQVPRLTLSGDGIQGEISAVVGLASTEPLAASFDLTLEPHRLVPVPSAANPVRLSGEVDARQRSGSLSVTAQDLPSELALVFLADEASNDERLQGWRVDVEADLSLGGAQEPRRGVARLRLARNDETWLTADAELLPEAGSTEIAARIETLLLPDLEGRRSFRGILSTAAPDRSGDMELRDGALEIKDTDLSPLIRDLETLWPGLVPEDLARSLGGNFEAPGRVEGPISGLQMALESAWVQRDSVAIRLSATGTPQQKLLDAKLEADRFGLSQLSPDLRGEVIARGSVQIRPEGYRWRASLSGSDLGVKSSDPTVEDLQAELSGTDQQVLLENVTGHLDGRPFRGRGSLELPAPIRQASVSFSLEQPLPGLKRVDLSLSLEDGVLIASAQPWTATGVAGQVEAALPWNTLERMPQLSGALSEVPVVGKEGPLRLSWELPEADWIELVSLLLDQPTLTSARFASRGSLTVNPLRPLAGSGETVVEALRIESPELAVAARQPMKLRLDRGELILEPTRLETDRGVLDVEVWSEMAREWQPGMALEAALRRFEIEASGMVPMVVVERFIQEVQTEGDLQLALSVSGTTDSLTGELRVLGPDTHLTIGGAEGTRLSEPVLEAVFEGDRVRVDRAEVEIDNRKIVATAEMPLATILAMIDSGDREPTPSVEPLVMRWQVPAADWAPTLRRLGADESLELARAGGRGELRIDPMRAVDVVGWFEISPLTLKTGGHEVSADGPLRIDLSDGRLELTSIRLLADDQPFDLAGGIQLDRGWSPGSGALSLAESLELEGRGTLAAALLNPFLAGGAAEGLLQLDFDLQGPLEELEGRLKIEGPEASVLFISPYVTKIEAPEFDIRLVDGRARIHDGRVVVNDGDVELGGSLGLDGIDLLAYLDGLRFRLDYGLLARIDGDLNLKIDSEGRGRLSGELIVDQGTLTRSINIDRDLISQLLSPIDLTGTEDSLLDRIELDLGLETRRGVRIRNNVADLGVRWNAVDVRGTVAEPVIDGRFDIEPGGRVFLFGQTLRVDRGAVSFPGQPGAAATLDLETTSSIDDPSISRLQGDDRLALATPEPTEPAEDLETRARELGWATAAYLSEQIATRITEVVPGARLTFRPILIFGEADPGARLTIGREFSGYVTLAASIDLRNAERQTYLMDAHDLPGLPGLVLQVFTNDENQEGATLQHRIRFGRYRRKAPTGPRLRRLEIEEVSGISRRRLKRAAGLTKGDRASADDLFLAEVEIGESLRHSGYPDARVLVTSRPVPERPTKVDVDVSIRPGILAHFRFEGEELSKTLRRSITALYRSDFYEPVAIEEMKAQTVRVLRSLGYLRPEVDIEVEATPGAEAETERQVTIRTRGGERLPLETLIVDGLSEEEADRVTSSFATGLQRIELAAGEPAAEKRLLSSVRALGYPQPEIVDRRLSEDRREFTIVVEPGPIRLLTAVRVSGVDTSLASDLARVAEIEAGDPTRRDRIAAGALAIESKLQSKGYADARVTPRVEGVDRANGSAAVDLVYEVDMGTAYTVADSRIEGLQSTSKRWATSVAEMESGAPLRESEVVAARSRLYETGLFTMVGSDSVLTEGNRTEVIFDVEERPRFSVAYGFRWDDDEGTQGVVDLVDRNFLGRNVTVGLRALYAKDDRSVRFGAGVPRILGTRAVLELFASYRDVFNEEPGLFTTTQFDEQILESSLQLAYPFGRHVFGRIYGRYRTDDLLITDIDEDPIFPLPPTSNRFNFKRPLLGTLWTYDSRDRELVLTRGIFASLDLSGTGDFLGSDFEYVRTFGQFNLYQPIGRLAGRGFSWAQSYRLGLADSFDQELDRNDRFFAGGQYSVRGYPTDSLGPVEELGDMTFPLGGKTLVVINQELRYQLLGPVAGLVFFDLGNVWEDTAEIDSDLFKSLGVGLRAVTPVGLLRLDWAFPLDRRPEDPSYKLYFGFGNTF